MFIKRSNTVILDGNIAIGVEKREVIYVTSAMHNGINFYNLTILENNRPIFVCAFYLQTKYIKKGKNRSNGPSTIGSNISLI